MRETKPRGRVAVNQSEWRISSPKKELVETHSDIDMNCNSRSFEVSNEEFPVVPSINKTNPSEAQESINLNSNSDLARNSSAGSLLSFEISDEEFPILLSIKKTSPSEAQESVQLIYKSERARKSSSSSHLDIEFGTYRHSQSLVELPLLVKDEPADSSFATIPVLIPTTAMEKQEFAK